MSSISNSSSGSSSNSTKDLIERLNNRNIISCAIGLSKIKGNFISREFCHASLFLYDQNSEDDLEVQEVEGILVEYGDYYPDMSKEESNKVKDKEVIYHYNEKGGLRYYGCNKEHFIKEFSDIGYIDMSIQETRRKSFKYFMEQIAPTTKDTWTRAKYKVNITNGFIGKANHHCQIFVAEALKILKPNFSNKDINLIDNSYMSKGKKSDILPYYIKIVLDELNKNK